MEQVREGRGGRGEGGGAKVYKRDVGAAMDAGVYLGNLAR